LESYVVELVTTSFRRSTAWEVELPRRSVTRQKLLQALFALSPSRLAGHAAVHSPGVHLLLTETHVYAAAARYVHAAVAAGFTAGWYIEHKLVLTRHGEEHTASLPGPDNGLGSIGGRAGSFTCCGISRSAGKDAHCFIGLGSREQGRPARGARIFHGLRNLLSGRLFGLFVSQHDTCRFSEQQLVAGASGAYKR
jgi:hypothetical protein